MKSIKNISISAIMVLALLILFPLAVQAAPVGEFTMVQGTVDITSPGQAAMPANVGDLINQDDIIRTGSGSRADIRFVDGNILRLADDTRIEVSEYVSEVEKTSAVLNLFRGKAQSLVSTLEKTFGQKKDNRYEVRTPTAVIGVRGTNFFVWFREGISGAAFQKGSGYVYNANKPDDVKIIKAGQTMLVVSPDEPPIVKPATDSDLSLGAGLPEGYTPPDDDDLGGTGGGDDGTLPPPPPPPYIPPDLGGGDGFTNDFADLVINGFPGAEVSGTFDETTGTGTLNITGSLPVSDDNTQSLTIEGTILGAEVEGYLGGIIGTWEGILTTIYEQDGDVGYLYGTLSDPLYVIGGTLNADGDVQISSALGEIEGTLSDNTYDWNLPLPILASVSIGGAIGADSEDSYNKDFFQGLTTTDGIGLGVWGLSTAGSYSNDDGLEDWGTAYGTHGTLQYGDTDPVPYYMFGNLFGTDDLNGHVTITSRNDDEIDFFTNEVFDWENDYLAYMDGYNAGSIGLEYRGTYDSDGNYQSVGSGTFTLIPLAFSAELDSVYWVEGSGFVKNDSIAGLMGGTADLWGESDVTLMGRSPINLPLWAMNMEGSSNLADGGSFWGLLDFMSKDNVLTGNAVGLYIKPDGSGEYNAGYLSLLDLSGTVYSGIGMWEANGYLTAETPEDSTTVSPEDLSWDSFLTKSPFSDSITDDNLLSGDIVGESYGITGQGWGIFRAVAGGYTDTDEDGYWIASGIGRYDTDSSNFGYGGSTYGYYLTETILGSFSGEISSSDPDSDWTMTLDTEVPPTLLAYSGYSYGSLLYNDWGNIGLAGDTGWDEIVYAGLIGGLTSPWDDPADFMTMGEYLEFGEYGGCLWSSWIDGEDTTEEDRGYFKGFTSAIWKDGIMDGAARAIYVSPPDPQNNDLSTAGILFSDLSGNYYEMWEDSESWGMWMAQGTLTPKVMATDLDLGDVDIGWGGLYETCLAGYFIRGDSMPSEIYGEGEGETLFLYDSSSDTPFTWGIYDLMLGNSNSYSGKPEGETEWSATIGGYGSFDNEGEGYWLADIGSTWSAEDDDGEGEITGLLSGRYLTDTQMGTIQGPFFGLYDEDGDDESGTWIGESVGTFEGEPLTFGGYWGGDSLHYYDSGDLTFAGDNYGLIGGVTAPWDGPAYFLAMGEYYDDAETGGPYIWASDIDAGGDDGGFGGITGGIWKDEVMDGMALAIYGHEYTDEYNVVKIAAGILTADVSGNYYEDIGNEDGMWMAEGTFIPVELVRNLEGEIFIDDTSDLYFEGYGSFDEGEGGTITVEDSEGTAMNFEDQYWGIWGTMLGGTYTETSSDIWTLSLTGYDVTYPVNFWVEVDGSQWSDGEIAGKVAGAWVELDVAMTGVMGGETIGTFNPTNDTWQAVAAGSWMETSIFLGMAAVRIDDAGNPELDELGNTIPMDQNQIAMLNQLNIPCIEVGRTDLTYSGSGPLTAVDMNDVTFFAYSTGAMPRIWATGAVSGITDGTDPAGSTALLNGAGFSDVEFHMNNYGAVEGNWDASVNGAGIVSGHAIDITGGAAGTVDADTAFSGTGAGVATPTPPLEVR